MSKILYAAPRRFINFNCCLNNKVPVLKNQVQVLCFSCSCIVKWLLVVVPELKYCMVKIYS